jgi:hypothetical protein
MRHRTLLFLIALVAVFAFGAGAALAQKRVIQGKDRVIYKKKTVIDFEDATVEGELVKPEGSYMIHRGRTKFNSLIKYRADFRMEIWKNAKKL